MKALNIKIIFSLICGATACFLIGHNYGTFFFLSPTEHENTTQRVALLEKKISALSEAHATNTSNLLGALKKSPAKETTGTTTTPHSKWIAIQKQAKDAVVQIFAQVPEFNWLEPYKVPNHAEGSGTGFFINEEGDILTNFHVVGSGESIQIQMPILGRKRLEASIIGASPERDVALLRLSEDAKKQIRAQLGAIPFLPFGDSDKLPRGQEILALGFPLGMEHIKGTQGIISGLERMGLIDSQLCFQMTAAINPGNSGGPSIDEYGNVIGINFAIIKGANSVAFVIPINDVKHALKDLYTVKLLRKPKLGCGLCPSSKALAHYLATPEVGCYVTTVVKNSLAEKIGIKTGDIVYQVNGHQLDFYGDTTAPWSDEKVSISDILNRESVGDPLEFLVYRKGESVSCKGSIEPRYLLPVRQMFPGYETIDYEVFGGLVVMNLSLNHIMIFAEHFPTLIKYTLPDNFHKSAVIITHLLPTSAAYKNKRNALSDNGTLMPGLIIDEINGEKIKNLEEFRSAIKKSADSGFTVMKTEDKNITVFNYHDLVADENRLKSMFNYQSKI